jgi:hypothetical protein
MTTGSGLFLSEDEKDTIRQNQAIRQLMEGRSNAVGTVTLAHDGVATTTTVSAQTCGPNSAVFLFPTTAHAAAVVASTYIKVTDVTPKQFIVTHATTSNTDVIFFYVCLG